VHALATQSAAARVACALAYPRTDELFVAALLHDVGKLVLAFAGMRCSDDRGRADRTPEGRIERERSETGVDHALVGGVLARRWGLPQSLAYAIERHHRPGEPELAGMVRLADMIAHFEAGHAVNGESMLAAAADVGLSAPALRAMLAAGPGRTMQRTLPSPLTPGEQRIIAELAKGKVYKQIAHTLDLSVSTVRTHLYNSYRKLGVPDRAHAVMLAKQHGWV
jgi:putative nucleotidyltransferase with HDIG domain